MKQTLAALVEIQRLDERIAVLRRRLDSLPVELSERESGHSVLEAENEALDGRRQAALLRSRELEGDVRAAEQRIEELERKSRSLRDAGAVQVAQHEVQELRDKISSFQDEELQLLEDADRLAEQSAAGGEKTRQSAVELEDFRRAVAADLADLQGQVDELMTERQSRIGALPSSPVSVYEQMLEKRKGRAVCPLKGSSCGGCGMMVPPNDRLAVTAAAKMVRCRSCLRIMVPAEVWSPPEAAADQPGSGEA